MDESIKTRTCPHFIQVFFTLGVQALLMIIKDEVGSLLFFRLKMGAMSNVLWMFHALLVITCHCAPIDSTKQHRDYILDLLSDAETGADRHTAVEALHDEEGDHGGNAVEDEDGTNEHDLTKRPPPLPWAKRLPSLPWNKKAPLPLPWDKKSKMLLPLPWDKRMQPEGLDKEEFLRELTTLLAEWETADDQKRVPSLPTDKRVPALPMDKRLPVLPWNKRLPALPLDKRVPSLPWNKRLPALPWNKRLPALPLDKRVPALPWNKRLPSLPWNKRLPALPLNKRLPSLPPYKKDLGENQLEDSLLTGLSKRLMPLPWDKRGNREAVRQFLNMAYALSPRPNKPMEKET